MYSPPPTVSDTPGCESLTEADYAALEQSWITREAADYCGIRRVSAEEGRNFTNRRNGNYAGIVFPYYLPGHAHPREFRLRRDEPDYEQKADGELKVRNKYISPPGKPSLLYFVPGCPPSWLQNKQIPVCIVEGEKKALAMGRYFAEREQKVLVAGVGGVWNWRMRVREYDEQEKAVIELSKPIADLDLICWIQRRVWILFDGDALTNHQVAAARMALRRELTERGSCVRFYDLPPDGPKGVDDFLYERGADALAEILNHEQGTSWPLHELTDVGMVERICDYAPGSLLYVDEWQKWGHWTGKCWDFREGVATLQRVTVETSHLALREAERQADPEGFEKWSRKYRSAQGLAAIRHVASLDARFRERAEIFDANAWLLPVANGTLDLRTGRLIQSESDHRMTAHLEVEWDEDAQCPLWEAFIEKILLGDSAMVRFIRQAVGYTLTGDTTEQAFFICHGETGGNGKSTFLDTLKAVLGHYGKVAAMSTFRAGERVSGHTDDLASLRGARLVICSEQSRRSRLNSELIKKITGDASLRASFKGQSFFEFRNTFKIWLATNHLPEVDGDDEGLWRRLFRIAFLYQFSEEERDKHFLDKLRPEYPGILAWAVRGLLDKQQYGFLVPERVREATSAYKAESDKVQQFIDDCCVLIETGQTSINDLVACWNEWAESNRAAQTGSRELGIALTRKGFETRKSNGRTYKLGLMIARQNRHESEY